jgi:hypothetical protein
MVAIKNVLLDIITAKSSLQYDLALINNKISQTEELRRFQMSNRN